MSASGEQLGYVDGAEELEAGLVVVTVGGEASLVMTGAAVW